MGEPTIVGSITRMDTVRSRLRILVEENPRVQEPLDPGGSKIWFTIWEQTAVLDIRGQSVARVGASSLRTGLHVEAITYGVILESYPAQAGADTVVILR